MKRQSIIAEVRKAVREELKAASAPALEAAIPAPPVEPPPESKPELRHDPVLEDERFPLRASHLAVLQAQVQSLGATAVAAAVGTSPVHLEYYAAGGVPSVHDRQRIINWLLRSGAWLPAPGDFPFDPDQSEDPRAVKRWQRRYGPEAR